MLAGEQVPAQVVTHLETCSLLRPIHRCGLTLQLCHGPIWLQVARLAPQDVGFVSVHGTGTPLGDPIEVGALGQGLAVPRGDTMRVTLGAFLGGCSPAKCPR
jgi:Beta-ketoacyl synthase, C-terminal domain